jgi:hypothetical protein
VFKSLNTHSRLCLSLVTINFVLTHTLAAGVVPQKLAKQFHGGANALDALQAAYRERALMLTALNEVHPRACEQHELAAYTSNNRLYLLYTKFMTYTRPGERPWPNNTPGAPACNLA